MIKIEITADTPEQARAALEGLLGGTATVTMTGQTLDVAALAEAAKQVPDSEKTKPASRAKKDEPKAPPAEEPKTEAPKEEPKVDEPKTETQGGVKVEGLSYDDDVKPAILRLSMSKGREAVFRVLKAFGAEKSANEIDPSKWAEVIEMVDEELKAA